MKKRNLFGFLYKSAPVVGITEAKYCGIVHAIEAELGVAAARQRPGASEPSAYMKGLLFALKLLAECKPTTLEV